MSIEREIKLTLPASQIQAAGQYFTARTGEPGRAVPLENIYFDTVSLTLVQAKLALRLRKTPHGWLQTLKAAGAALGGLHSRHEWETPVTGGALALEALYAVCDDASACGIVRTAAPELVELFRTTFTRRLWVIEHDGTQIEAAMDRGEVNAEVNGVEQHAPISEIELELIEGDEAALMAFATDLQAAVPGLVPDNMNKAQRGYALRAG